MKRLAKLLIGMSPDCRQNLFVWWLSVACYAGIMTVAMTRQGELAGKVVDALSGLLEVVVCTYLGVDVVHRSDILRSIGDRFKGPDQTPPSQQ